MGLMTSRRRQKDKKKKSRISKPAKPHQEPKVDPKLDLPKNGSGKVKGQ